MDTTNRVAEKRTDWVCTGDTKKSSDELEAGEARAMLSELRGTALPPGGEWDDEARAQFAAFQRSEGLPPTGDLDDVSVARLKRRFDAVVQERQASGVGELTNKSPTVEAHGRVLHMVKEAAHAVETVTHQLGHDAALRARFAAETKEYAGSIIKAFEQGKISEGEAAYLASTFRRNATLEARGGMSPAGAALSKFLKEHGATLPQLVEKYAMKHFGKAAKELTAAERNAVCLKIAKDSGMTSSFANTSSRLAPYVGKALTAVAIGIAFYQVATAEDKVGEAVKQGAGFLGFWAGAKLGAMAGAAVCGPASPACAVVGGIAGGILGAMAAEAAAQKTYHVIKG